MDLKLRDMYMTATEDTTLKGGTRIPPGAAKVLVNHAWGNEDVTEGYRSRDLGFLAECQDLRTLVHWIGISSS